MVINYFSYCNINKALYSCSLPPKKNLTKNKKKEMNLLWLDFAQMVGGKRMIGIPALLWSRLCCVLLTGLFPQLAHRSALTRC